VLSASASREETSFYNVSEGSVALVLRPRLGAGRFR